MTPCTGDPNGLPDENDSDSGGVRTMRSANTSMGEFAAIPRVWGLGRVCYSLPNRLQ